MLRFLHKKRGSTYQIIGKGKLQTSMLQDDDAEVVLYRADNDGSLWVRPVSEFEDGRFEQIESNIHSDDLAVDRFADAMKEKLAKKRAEGRGGWDDKVSCSNHDLSTMLLDHVSKGDPIDVCNFAMMVHQRGERIFQDGGPAPSLDEAFFADFIEWNFDTYGPGLRTEGTVKHIRKELAEIVADPTDPKEWVDVGILAFNGLIRLGLKPAQLIAAFLGKHAVNKARTWPDWRNHPDTPIEHDRSGE